MNLNLERPQECPHRIHVSTGKDKNVSAGQESCNKTGQNRKGKERIRQDRTGQDRTGQDRTGQIRTEQHRTGQDRNVRTGYQLQQTFLSNQIKVGSITLHSLPFAN